MKNYLTTDFTNFTEKKLRAQSRELRKAGEIRGRGVESLELRAESKEYRTKSTESKTLNSTQPSCSSAHQQFNTLNTLAH